MSHTAQEQTVGTKPVREASGGWTGSSRHFLPAGLVLLGSLLSMTSLFVVERLEHSGASGAVWRVDDEPEFRGTVDCGAAALYLISRSSGKDVSLPYLRDLTKTSSTGTSMFNLKEAAILQGFQVEALRGPFRVLQEHVEKPGHYAICHLKTNHFVAVLAVAGKKSVRILDPTIGIEDLTAEQMRDRLGWSGAMLLLTDFTLNKGG